MAPKKTRTRGESVFVSEAARSRFHEAIEKRRVFIPERGFQLDLEEGYRHWFLSKIRDKGWECFCAPREDAVIPVVREFYANVPEHQNGQIRVRGRDVHFDGATINQLFRLPVPDIDEYAEFASGDFTPEKAELVREALTTHWVSWEMHNDEYIAIERKCLYDAANVWFYFVVSSMMPVTNLHLCRRERAILIYAILAEKSINVGDLIHKVILQAAARPKGGFWFPSLITMLCRQARVPIAVDEEILPPGTIMTAKRIEKLCNPSPRITRAHGATTSSSTSRPEEPPTEVLIRQIQQENTARHRYVEECFKRVEDMFRFNGAATGIDMTGHPSIPSWSSYQQNAQMHSGDGAREEHQSSSENNSND